MLIHLPAWLSLFPTDAQIIVVNMTDADDLRRHHFADYLQSTKAKTAQAKYLEATRYCGTAMP
jgi:hypothetical protein